MWKNTFKYFDGADFPNNEIEENKVSLSKEEKNRIKEETKILVNDLKEETINVNISNFYTRVRELIPWYIFKKWKIDDIILYFKEHQDKYKELLKIQEELIDFYKKNYEDLKGNEGVEYLIDFIDVILFNAKEK